MTEKLKVGDIVKNIYSLSPFDIYGVIIFKYNEQSLVVFDGCSKGCLLSDINLTKIPDKPKHEFNKCEKVWVECIIKDGAIDWDGELCIIIPKADVSKSLFQWADAKKCLKPNQVIVLDDSEIKEGDKVVFVTTVKDINKADETIQIHGEYSYCHAHKSSVFKLKM